MSTLSHFGEFDSSKIYTQRSLAKILDRDQRYVRNLLRLGLKHAKIGQEVWITGHHLMLFFEKMAEGGCDLEEEADEIPETKGGRSQKRAS